MTEQQIRTLVQNEIQKNSSALRFSINTIPHHTHNRIDSPPVFQSILTYVGAINANGGLAILPSGWGILGSNGNYTVTHNLGASAIYSVVATANDFLDSAVTVTINQTANYAQFTTWLSATGVLTACGFTFSLTVINNRSLTLPTYVTL